MTKRPHDPTEVDVDRADLQAREGLEQERLAVHLNLPIGSVSKTFIAAALVKAVALGHLTLDTPINDILPRPIVNPYHPGSEIRVHHLVTHRSGLIDQDEAYASTYFLRPDQDLTTPGARWVSEQGAIERDRRTLGELIDDYYYEDGALYSAAGFGDWAPGDREEYSNLASSLAAYLIELTAGVSYADFVDEHVLGPLGMTRSGYALAPDATFDEAATLYLDGVEPLPRYGLDSYPDGALHSSASDLARFLGDMSEGYAARSTQLFEREHYAMLFEPRGAHAVFWDVGPRQNYSHSGGDPGLATWAGFSGEIGGGFVILANSDALDDAVATEISELVVAFLDGRRAEGGR